MSKIRITYLKDKDGNQKVEQYDGVLDVLSCGVVLIKQEEKAGPSLISSLAQEVHVGIPLSSIEKYEVRQS